MGDHKLIKEINLLKEKLIGLHHVMDEVWTYHPSNPNFINPITLYKELKDNISSIERKINDLEFKINSLN
jgi:hypothetical protein